MKATWDVDLTAEQWQTYLDGRSASATIFAKVRAHPGLTAMAADVARAYATIASSLESGGTLFICGNGGSFSDGLHISGEMLKSFKLPRPLPDDLKKRLREQPFGDQLAEHLQMGLRAHVLGLNPALSSAVANDIPVLGIGYAQELLALGAEHDVLLGISTSGKAQNVRMAVALAKALGMATISLTGSAPNPLADLADLALAVPDSETFRVQELHLALYHQLCLMLEAHFFGS